MKKSIFFFVLFIFFTHFSFGQISNFIHVDQFGYLPDAPKIAVLSNPQTGYNSADSYTAPATLELRNANTDAVVFSAAPTAWNGGTTHAQSGDQGWWFDFSSYSTVGDYYVYDPTNSERSADFEIKETVYDETLKAAMKAFYYNRCNMSKAVPYAEADWADGNNFENALQDANCRFVNDASNASLEKDLTGGWFDAGDYNKYTTFANAAVQMLLSAYEDNPAVFGDDWNLPESGNGLPDILDEVKWELDWLLKMCNSDGSTIIKMGSISYAENVAAPPSANTDQRYYGLTCTSASIDVAGMFAHAAKVFEGQAGMGSFVTQLETEAEAAWNFVLPLINANQFDLDCDDLTITSGDADRTAAEQKEDALIAAIYLFDQIGTSTYNDYIIAHIADAKPMSGGNFWGGVKIPLYDALLNYTTLAGADLTTKNAIINSITTDATNNYSNYYGFGNEDLYRAFMPDWAYHWGSNLPKAGYGILNLLLNKYNINSDSSSVYDLKAKEQIHYFHGVNPLGLVYISNMYGFGADSCVNEIYHTWFADGSDWDNTFLSIYGPPPGYIVGGANSNYNANTSLTPPYNQPHQKSYLDFNTGFPDNSWELSEPAIYTQAFYVRLVANYASAGSPLAVEWLDPLWGLHKKGTHYLYWTTAAETNNNYFEIQRSANGHDWSKIGKTAATSNLSNNNKYGFKDTQPLHGLNYYRLRQVDLDGKFEYSNIITIQNKSIYSFKIIPNPTSGIINIQVNSSYPYTNIEKGKIDILDLNGKILLTTNAVEIDINHLPKGIYFVKITDKNGSEVVGKLIRK